MELTLIEARQLRLKQQAEKDLLQDIPKKNNNSGSELKDPTQISESFKPESNPPKRQPIRFNNSMPGEENYKGMTLEVAAKKSMASGKYINLSGEIADLDQSEFMAEKNIWEGVLKGDFFNSNGLVFIKPITATSPSGKKITEKTKDTIFKYPGELIASEIAKYDPETQLRMLVPGINPENGESMLKELVGTKKDFADRNVAISQAYGFQDEEDGVWESLGKGFLNTVAATDELVLGAARYANMLYGYSGMSFRGNAALGIELKELHERAIEKNELYRYLPSLESDEAFTWDWFGANVGNGLGSLTQFGAAGRLANITTGVALRAAGSTAFRDFAKRQVAEKIARYGASATIGFGYAMTDAQKSGLNEVESFAFATVVGLLNTVIESKLNVDFDRMLMGNSTRTITKSLMRELAGDFSTASLNNAFKVTGKMVLAGGKPMLKRMGAEGIEEILQTGVEQSARTFHDIFYGSGRINGEGKFAETGINLEEIAEAGFFGGIVAGPSSIGSSIREARSKDGYMQKMITEGKGSLIIGGIDELYSRGQIDQLKHQTIKKDALFKIEQFEKNSEAFYNLRGFKNAPAMTRDLYSRFIDKGQLQIEKEGFMSELAKDSQQTPEVAKQQAEEIKKKIEKVDAKLKEVQASIDQYKNRDFVSSENSRYNTLSGELVEKRNKIFEDLTTEDQTATDFTQILDRFISYSKEEQNGTALVFNDQEAKLVVDAIRTGEAAKKVDPKVMEDFMSGFGDLLRMSKFYLSDKINTDENRKILLKELGLDEKQLPLTESEKKAAEKDPAAFKDRTITQQEITAVINSAEFQAALDDHLKINGMNSANMDADQIQLNAQEVLIKNGEKFGVTEAKLHSLNEKDEVFMLLENDSQREAINELIDVANRPLSYLTGQLAPNARSNGFHSSKSGMVILNFDKQRIKELLAKKLQESLSVPESKELKDLQDDLFHKLTHETTHNFFDIGLNKLFYAHVDSVHKKVKSKDALIFKRLLSLATLAYQAKKKNPAFKRLYFNSVYEVYEKSEGQEQLIQSLNVVKEFFAEAMSNESFQKILDEIDLGSSSNKKLVNKYYDYGSVKGGFGKSLLQEVVKAFQGVFSSFSKLLRPTNRTVLAEAFALGSKIKINRFSKNSVDEAISVSNMDISMFNPRLIIDTENEFISPENLPIIIYNNLKREGFGMTELQYNDFKKKIDSFISKEIVPNNTIGEEAKSLKVVYFGITDTFLFSWTTTDAAGKKLNNRQFFNRYGNTESLNTNVFNSEKENSVKKGYTFSDFEAEEDGNSETDRSREVASMFHLASLEGFSGDATLVLNEDKLFGTKDKKFKGEIEILYTFQNGETAVIGFAPDLAKPRLARMLSMGAVIPINVRSSGPGSVAFVLFNDPSDPTSGIRRAVNPQDAGWNIPDELLNKGYVRVERFLPRSTFNFQSARVTVDPKAIEQADAADTLTVMDESLPIDWGVIGRLTDSNIINREFDQRIIDSETDEALSFYNDLNLKNPIEERIWYFRDKISKALKFKAMTGMTGVAKLDHLFSYMNAQAELEILAMPDVTEKQLENAKRLGFDTESELIAFKNTIVSEERVHELRNEGNTGTKQDWDSFGLNPNDTVFALVKAQIEQLSYTDPKTGLSKLVTIEKARELLFIATRESRGFDAMVAKFLELVTDSKLDQMQREIARALYRYYSAPIINSKVAQVLAETNSGLSARLIADITKDAAGRATGTESFKTAIEELSIFGILNFADGTQQTYTAEEVKRAATILGEYYASDQANYTGLVRYFGSNSLFTAFASLRKIDSISLIPSSNGSSIMVFNGKKKVKDEVIQENEHRIRGMLKDIRSKHALYDDALKELQDKVKMEYQKIHPNGKSWDNTLLGPTIAGFLNANTWNAQVDKLNWLDKSGNGITDNWMQNASPAVYAEMMLVLKAFYSAYGIDLPIGMFYRNSNGNKAFMQQETAKRTEEFLESMADNGIAEGSTEYLKAQEELKAGLSITQRSISGNKYAYPTSKFGRKGSKNEKNPRKQSAPMMALLIQGAFFLNTKSLSYFKGDADTELLGDELKKLLEEQLMFGRINQSDDMYFDPKGNKRFSIKIKSQADSIMEDLSMNREGILQEMLSLPLWRNNLVLQKINSQKGRPIDVAISGIRTWTKGMLYSEATDVDFVYMTMASFTSMYDYGNEYIHIDDIPSDKPTIYGYRLNRLDKSEFITQIQAVIDNEETNRQEAEGLFTKAFKRGKDGSTIRNQEVFDSLVSGIHYTVSEDGKYLPGKLMNKNGGYFQGKSAGAVLSGLRAEATETYRKMKSQGLKIALNRTFIEQNDPEAILENERKRLFFNEENISNYPESLKLPEWQNEVKLLTESIAKMQNKANMGVARTAYKILADERREELFVQEFYPNHAINKYHLSRILMGDSAFYNGVFDMNKRKAGPGAPFYRGAWARPTANLVALDDIGDAKGNTIASLSTLDFQDGKFNVIENSNEVKTARTDAQGYVTEQFAEEMVAAYGAFSGFQKIFKPVMFGVNRVYLRRGQPLYMKLSVAIIPDPNNPKNEAHYQKFPNQLDFAKKFYASKGDIALFKSGVKVGFRNNNNINDKAFKTQLFDLSKFGLQNDPETSVEDEESKIAGGVQRHKQLADNGNFQAMLAYYAIESQILSEKLKETLDKKLSSKEKVRDQFLAQLLSQDHTASLGEFLKNNSLELFDNPLTAESAQNMVASLFNKAGNLPKINGKKFVNMSDFMYDELNMVDQDQIDAVTAFVNQGFYSPEAEGKPYALKWAGPRKTTDLHPIDFDLFNTNINSEIWFVNDVSGFIEDKDGNPIIYPADVLVPENSAGLIMGTRLINTRIPTTGKASNIPSRVVGYLPKELGNVIVTPKEGPGILGFDFDVDGLFAWTDTKIADKRMSEMFAIAFNVLTDPMNYNELTSPVGTDKLKTTAAFYTMSEAEVEGYIERGEEIPLKNSPSELFDYGFSRQLEMMKMNSIGKAFIGSSASFSAIYSVFSQTGTRLQDLLTPFFSIQRIHYAPGSKRNYPAKQEDGSRISDVFVQLINAATDNVKEMLLARNGINLTTGDVLMDMVSHGISLDYAVAFINQPAVRDIVAQSDKNNSVTTSNDFLRDTDRVLQKYIEKMKLINPNYKHLSTVFFAESTRDGVYFSEESLRKMYLMGDKSMSIDDVQTEEDLFRFFRNKFEPNEQGYSELQQALKDQMIVIEKFKFYSQLSKITRAGGNLVMMYSKNPKNFIELRKIKRKIDNTYFSKHPKLSDQLFSHPSYLYQYGLVEEMRKFYHENMLVADNLLDQHFLTPVIQAVGENNAQEVHDALMNSIIFRELEESNVDSSILNGYSLTSLEFVEIFVRLLHDNREAFIGNSFMEQLNFEVSDTALQDIGKGLGKASEISFNGTKDFSPMEIGEINEAFNKIPTLTYQGYVVNVQDALIYYLAVTKGFGMGGYNFSKILPPATLLGMDSAIKRVKELVKENIERLRSESVVNPDTDLFEEEEEEFYDPDMTSEEMIELAQNAQLAEFDVDLFREKLGELLDPFMNDSISEFREKFFKRNDKYKQLVFQQEFSEMIAENGQHFDKFSGGKIDPSAYYKGPGKVVFTKEGQEIRLFFSDKKSDRFKEFLERSNEKGGFILINDADEKKIYLSKGVSITENGEFKNVEYVFLLKETINVPTIYEPTYITREHDSIYSPGVKAAKGVDISTSAKHLNATDPTLLEYFEKDKKKFSKANKLISRGSKNSSSNSYAVAAENVTNLGEYTASDVVGISAEGSRINRVSPDLIEIQLAIDAGVTFVTDIGPDRNRSFNVGEQEVANYLLANGYVEGKKPVEQKVENLTSSKKIEVTDRYSDADAKANPDKIYVFGDNTQRVGTGGQASIRNNSNAFGIATKLKPANSPDSFMSDNDLENNKKIIDADINSIKSQDKQLVFPKDGFGTGLAKLKEKAPKTYQYLKDKLLQNFGFDNDTGEINSTSFSETTAFELQYELTADGIWSKDYGSAKVEKDPDSKINVISNDYGVLQTETNPSADQTKNFVDIISPQISAQTYKENKGEFANEMFHYGLMWSRTNSVSNPVKINAFEKSDYYSYHSLDQNGNSLPSLATLKPIIDQIQSSIGIDMSDYDSVIGNIYLDGQYVYPHKDTTESKSARNYPVIVYTIGNNAGLGIVDNNQGKMTFANQYDSKWLPSSDKLKGYTNELSTKNGSIYTFGFQGKGRFELTHSTPTSSVKKESYPPIVLPNGKTITNYTITLTFRRAMDLDSTTPSAPLETVSKETVLPWKDRIVDLAQDFNSLDQAVTNKSVILTDDPGIIEYLTEEGFVPSTANPMVYYSAERDRESYTPEQFKKLKNEC